MSIAMQVAQERTGAARKRPTHMHTSIGHATCTTSIGQATSRRGNGPLAHHRARDDKRGGAEQHSLYRRSHCQPAPPSPRPPARPPVAGSSWLFPFRNWHWTRAGAAWMKASTGAAWGRASMHAHTGSASGRPGAVHPEAWQAAMGGIAGPAREASGGNHRHPAQHPLLLL